MKTQRQDVSPVYQVVHYSTVYRQITEPYVMVTECIKNLNKPVLVIFAYRCVLSG